jgi:hypothetical protein
MADEEKKPAVKSPVAAPTVDVRALLANMSQADLSALLATAAARHPRSETPKLSATLDAVSAEKADRVIEALAAALDGIEARAADPLAALRTLAPEIETAIVTNSTYRRKDLRHSVDVARRYLEGRHGPAAVPARR